MIEGEKFIKELSYSNDRRFVILKAAEECGELNVDLLQAVTKPQNFNRDKILSEIADVEIQLIALKELLQVSEEEMQYLKTSKINKLREYKNVVENFGQI